MSLSVNTGLRPAQFSSLNGTQRPLHHNANANLHFSGISEDKFIPSKKADDLDEGTAQRLVNQTQQKDLINYYQARLLIIQEQFQRQAKFWQGQKLHDLNNPQGLSYFDLLELIQEKSDQHPQRFMSEIATSMSDLARQASKRLFNRNIDTNKLKSVQKTWDDKDAKGCFPDNLEEVMGPTERAYLPYNLKLLAESHLINTGALLKTGDIQQYDDDKNYHNKHQTGIMLTPMGKAILTADDMTQEQLVDMMLPPADPWSTSAEDVQQREAMRELLKKEPLPEQAKEAKPKEPKAKTTETAPQTSTSSTSVPVHLLD